VAVESPHIIELRRRVQADPTSIAFAQLAEEYRRAGKYDEAIKCCRTGLGRHPGYLSARVTLGRALMEVGVLDEASREFDLVLRSAPDNFAAIRGMAEIHQRKGALEPALAYYKRALSLARHDPELEETVGQIGCELGTVGVSSPAPGLSFAEAHNELLSAALRWPEPPPRAAQPAGVTLETAPALQQTPAPAASIPDPPAAAPPEPLIDFDALLRAFGIPGAAPPRATEMLLSEQVPLAASAMPLLHECPAEVPSSDPFAELERALRSFDEAPTVPPSAASALPSAPEPDITAVLDELEAWLAALYADRTGREHPSA